MVIVVVGFIALVANAILVPSGMHQASTTTLRNQLQVVTNSRLLLAFAITALGYGGTFVVFTYLSPLLHEVTGFPEQTTALILLVYGIAIAIGNVIGGKAANRKPITALFYMFSVQAVVLLILAFTAPFKAAGLITILLMGLFAFMNVPGLQVYVVMLAERFTPKSVDFASAMNISAFNAGIALGAYIGGIIADQFGLIHTPWVGAVMVLGAVLLTGWSRALDKQQQSEKQSIIQEAC